MDFVLEFFLSGCIICLTYVLYSLKTRKDNAISSLTEQYEDKLTQKELEFNLSINRLRSSLEKEQIFLEERQKELNSKEKKLLSDILDLESRLKEETEAKKRVTSLKKSSEVRLGHIAETLAPFLDQFDFDPENCTFLGKPIDYISFADDEITFIEVKSGKSQLNARQRHIRDQVKAGLVAWKEVRIK